MLIVNDQGQVEQKSFETVRSINNNWLVKDGLKAGDRVLVNGTQKVQAGMKVTAKVVDVASLSGADQTAKQ